MKTIVITLVMLLGAACVFAGDLVVDQVRKCVEERFDSFGGSFATLPAGFGVSINSNDLMNAGDPNFSGISTGNVQTGGCYAWMMSNTDRALGCQPTADKFTPGYFTVTVSNATGKEIRSAVISFDVVCRNNEDRSLKMGFLYSAAGGVFCPVPEFSWNSGSYADKPASWIRYGFTFKLQLNAALQSGSRLALRWTMDDADGSGSRDEVGIDNFTVVFHERKGMLITVR